MTIRKLFIILTFFSTSAFADDLIDSGALKDSPYLAAKNIVITAGNSGKILLVIDSDGKLEKGSGFRDDDAASKEVFDALAKSFPDWLAARKCKQ